MESKIGKNISRTDSGQTIKKSIEDGFYIVIDKLSTCNSGSIIRVKDGIVIDRDESRKKINMNDIERDKLDKIEENESNYLLKYKINERMEKHKNKIFNKIKELNIGDECYYKKDSDKIYIVKQKNIVDKRIEFVLQSKNSVNIRDINNVDAFDIGLIENDDKGEFYILTDTQHQHQIGTILRVENGIAKTFPDNVVIENQSIYDKKLRKIDIIEANFLKMFSISKRMKKVKNEKLKRINELNKGDKCFINDKEYVVDGKYLSSNELKFDLSPQKSSTDILVSVDASEIRLKKKWINFPYKKDDNLQPNLSSIGYPSMLRQNSTNSGTSIDSTDKNKSVGIYETIKCGSVKLKVINPKSYFEINKSDSCDISERYIVMRVESKQIFAKLLWKGIINYQICIGCEMLSNINIGTDGTFNNEKLFNCKNEKGVLIPLIDNVETCEKENCENHFELNANEIINENKICCLKETKSFESSTIKMGDKIIYNRENASSGICKWIGLINGKECVAVVSDENNSDYVCKTDELAQCINISSNEKRKAVMFQISYIPSIINCNPINCGVINPCSNSNIIVTISTKHKKYIVIKTKQKSELVLLLWKGKIGETICLGCELLVDWTYGTKGTFKEKNLFECPDKRGVLIVLSNEIETCESKDHPEHIDFDEYDVINKNNICCIEFAYKENLKDKTLFCSKNTKIRGLCTWMGIVNGKNCVGILYNDNSIFSSFEPLEKIKALQNLIFLSIKGVEILQLYFIHDKIVDINKIISVESVKFRAETKIVVDCSVTINIKLNDNYTKKYPGVVKWTGMINNEKCVGLDMEDASQYGMDGEIDENNRFNCKKRHGLVTLLSNVESYKSDETLHILENGIVNPDKIIKYEDKLNRDFSKEIKISDSVIVNLNNGDIKLNGTLRCCGLMNKSPVCVVELKEDHENGTDGRFWRSQLFQCPDKRAVAVHPKNILKYEPIKFIDDIFVDNKYYFHQIHFITNSNHYKAGKLVEIVSTPKLYGEIDGFFIYYDEQLLRIKLDAAQINNFKKFDKVTHKDPDPYYSKIIVKEKAVKEFKEPLELNKESYTINKSCIKYKALHLSENFEKSDFVKLNYDRDNQYFIVHFCYKINGIPCLAVTESILGDGIQYLKEKDVSKVDCSEFKLSYYNGVFIDPLSISSLKGSTFTDLSFGNIVKLQISELSLEFEGIITFTGIANGISVCVIKPRISSLQHVIQNYKINGQNKYYTLWNSSDEPLFMVPLNTIKRKNTFEIPKGISVMNPKLIKNMRGKKIKERIIIFKCNGEKHFAKLKWSGVIDKEYCYGCEIDFSTEFGTNGKFQDNILFDCKDEHGILIPVYTITDCCETDGHHQIIYYQSKVIDKNSICCIKSDENIGEKVQIKINDQIKRKELNEYPYCKWMGYVNKIECIGVEYNYSISDGCDGTFCGVKLFDSHNKSGALYKLSEFTSKMSIMKSIHGLKIIDPFYITNIENGKKREKWMIYKWQGQKHVLNIKWRGIVNGDLCIGCELSCGFEYGTNGIFYGENLFNCADRCGVLIPVSTLNNTCEENYHNAIELYSNGLLVWKNTPGAINPDCICCVEQLESIKKLPLIRIGSIIKYDKKKYGCCEWIGLINGKESIGARIQDSFNEGTNGLFKHFMLFQCEQKKGFLFLADNIEHDVENEKVYFIFDKIVDINKIYSVSLLDNNETYPLIKSPAKTDVTFPDGKKQKLIGEIKWIGKINNEKCVGLDMEDKFDFGMNGKIDNYHKFDCFEGHGMITLLNIIDLLKNIDESHFCKNGIINPNKYLACKENVEIEFLNSRNVKLNEFVFVLLKDSNGERKKKGKLRWCGKMNKLSVCIVELNEEHELGTDGRFWRTQLIKCGNKRAIAVLSNNIYPYEPYESMIIPVNDRIFKDIDINSAVKYYYEGDSKSLNGTVRWSGRDENGGYLYGIELDDRLTIGTDGKFNGRSLFICQNGHGILAAIDLVGKDTRFVDQDVSPEEIVKSKECQQKQSSILTKLYEGSNKGIQGNANSCYFDSAIFALFVKSDVLDFMIDEINNENETNDVTKQFRNILSFKIIYPLRKFGFVSFHKTNEMRDVIVKYGSRFEEMTKQESDMENVSALLSKLCPNEQLLSIISHSGSLTKCMFMQLFLTLTKKVKFMTSEEMLKISMVQNDIMFNEIPTCLIMQAPRDARGINCYEFVLPMNIIEISQVCSNYLKQCFLCENEAVYQCKECIEGRLDISSSFICENHKCHHNSIMRINIPNKSASKVYLELKSIICIEKCHFVCYVKQNDIVNRRIVNQWYFFDSMSSQSISNNYAIPKVTYLKDVTDFLNFKVDDMEKLIDEYFFPDLKRIVKDSYIFVYQNSAKSCY